MTPGGSGGGFPGGWGGSAATIALLLVAAGSSGQVGGRILDFADHERARDLVVPALLARVEGDPDQADVQGERTDQIPDIPPDRPPNADVLAGCGIDHVQAEQPLSEGAAELGPEDDEIEELDGDPGQLPHPERAEQRVDALTGERSVRGGSAHAVAVIADHLPLD